MSRQTVKAVVYRYGNALEKFREEWELSPLEEEAYQRFCEAADRLDEFEHAQLNDLHLQDAILITHRLFKWPNNELPRIDPDSPFVRVGCFQQLNAAIISYVNKFRRYCYRLDESGEELTELESTTLNTLNEAYERIEQARNADVQDLPLLEALHAAHRILDMDPQRVPHVDVTRKYEGPTKDDGIDVKRRIEGKKKGLTHREITEEHRARGDLAFAYA